MRLQSARRVMARARAASFARKDRDVAHLPAVALQPQRKHVEDVLRGHAEEPERHGASAVLRLVDANLHDVIVLVFDDLFDGALPASHQLNDFEIVSLGPAEPDSPSV